MPPKFANVRKIMLKHKRAAKCPFLQEFIVKSVALADETSFVSSEEIFKEYCRVVSLWTEEDSTRGQTQYLMKKGSFYRVSIEILGSDYIKLLLIPLHPTNLT